MSVRYTYLFEILTAEGRTERHEIVADTWREAWREAVKLGEFYGLAPIYIRYMAFKTDTDNTWCVKI